MDIEHQTTIAEDDTKRSEFVFDFIKSEILETKVGEIKIPKTIVQFWHDLEELPNDVFNCINSWKILQEKGFEFKLFDDSSAIIFIKENFDEKYLDAYLKCHHPAMRCDYFRLCYLHVFGGYYVDCDEVYSNNEIDFLYLDNNIKIQPLCYNINLDKMIDIENYINDDYDKSNIYYFNNNPIISPPNHELISIALERATTKLLKDENTHDIQSTTGPGNITAALVVYLLKKQTEITIIKNWNNISHTPWPLSYRNDNRNWRLYDAKKDKWFSQ